MCIRDRDNGNNGSTSPIWQFAIPTDYTDKALTRIGSLSFSNSVDSNQVTIEGPSSNPTTYTVILPAGAPTASGQTLQTTGSDPYSQLEWGASGGISTSTFNAHVASATAHHTATVNTWRNIDDTPANGVTDESISSNWAYDHENDTSLHGGEITGDGTGNRLAWWTSSSNITEGDYYASTGAIGSEGGTYPDITAGVLKAESSVKLKSVNSGTGDYDLQINTNGYLRKTSSSQRYKENIAALAVDSAKIYNLTAKSFKWIDTVDHDSNEDVASTVTVTGKNDFGLIAEEVHLELPELITYDDQNRPDAVNYKMLSVLLIEELKKLEARVKTLEAG